jgi:hypothetical protein
MSDRPGTTDQPPPGWDASASYLCVTYGDQHDNSTWSWATVRTGIRDRTAYEVEAHRRGWPSISDGGFVLMMRYTAWHALHERGDYPAPFGDFAQQAWDVQPVAAPDDAEPVGPTRPEGMPE